MGNAASGQGQALMRPFAVGASFRTADARIRDRLFVEPSSLPDHLKAVQAAGLPYALQLSTCDRVELMGCAEDPIAAAGLGERLLRSRLGDISAPQDAFHRFYDLDATRHIFQIACALDSQMIGESQILGQFKEAVQVATDLGLVQGEFDRLVQAALTLAKRVRSTTRIGEGAVSSAAAAVKVAQDLHGKLTRCRALLIGLGETGALVTDQFQRAGIGTVNLTGPARRTEREASRRGISYFPWDRLDAALAEADIVITAAGRGSYLIDPDNADRAFANRRHRPMLIVDVAIPCDVDPAVDRLDDVFRYTLSDIEALAEKGQLDRKAEAAEAAAMLENAVSEWRRSLAEREGVPGLVALREHFERLREEVLARYPSAGPEEITRLLVNRLLHEPSEGLRGIAGHGEAADLRDTITVNRVLERLFALRIQESEGWTE